MLYFTMNSKYMHVKASTLTEQLQYLLYSLPYPLNSCLFLWKADGEAHIVQPTASSQKMAHRLFVAHKLL